MYPISIKAISSGVADSAYSVRILRKTSPWMLVVVLQGVLQSPARLVMLTHVKENYARPLGSGYQAASGPLDYHLAP